MDHLKLLCDFGELSWIFTGTRDIQSFLKRIVILVISHTEADACSIFLYREESDALGDRHLSTIGIDRSRASLRKIGPSAHSNGIKQLLCKRSGSWNGCRV